MENYKEVKNLIHNELKITKEEIREMVAQAVGIEVSNLLKDERFIQEVTRNEIHKALIGSYKSPQWRTLLTIDQTIYDAVTKEVSKTVKDNLKISFGENP